MDQWLVRTAANIIAGPYSKGQVIQLIEDAKLGAQDEVCQANTFWFSLHEHEEVQRQLEIQLPRSRRASGEEITETQIDAQELDAPPVEDLPPPPDLPEEYDGSTAVMSRPMLREPAASPRPRIIPPASVSPAPVTPAVARAPSVHALMQRPQIERPSLWRGFAWLLVIAACLILVLVLRLLRSDF